MTQQHAHGVQPAHPSPTKLRYDFEDWMLTKGGGTSSSLHRRDMPGAVRAGEYCNEQVELLWSAWQASSAAAAGVPERVMSPSGKGNGDVQR